MNFFTAILLGIVQGLAEFLPISSSGHLNLIQNIFGIEDPANNNMLFDILLHLGTLAAVIIVYRRDIWEMIKEFFRLFGELTTPKKDGEKRTVSIRPKRRLLLMVIIGTVPLLAAALVDDYVEVLSGYNIAIGLALIVTGVILFLADRHKKGNKTEANASMWDALIVGISQAIAVVPGLSRSGLTISTGIFCGFDREFAVRFSFLLSIVAVIGANLISVLDADLTIVSGLVPMYVAGVITSGICGYFAIKLVKKLIDNNRFGYFSIYCWAIGLIAIAYQLLFG